ncbi:HAD family hydrolase [Streptacidiphilus sp. N1-12]|uniref:HAD family hydrolase n=2 Tax=Streptacidiphilus alkalitolerans TaxID=3342712 RepID=A0ABV6WYF7_9ACTN
MSRYLVFSDVDETLISLKSMFDFLRFSLVRQHGAAGEQRFAEHRRGFADAAAAGVPREKLNRDFYRLFAGQQQAEVETAGEAWYAERSASAGFFVESTVAALAGHRAAGCPVVLVSGSFAPVLAPIARQVRAEAVLSTELVVRSGRYTGEVVQPMIGQAKRAAVRRVLAERPDVRAEDCFAYGDHPSDIPMLDCVGRPVAVGSHPELAEYLEQRRLAGSALPPA